MAQAGLSFELPRPHESSPPPSWTGSAFRSGDTTDRVLAFAAVGSGWTDHLTDLVEQTAGADHFIDVASRAHAIEQLRRHLATSPATILEVGCSAGHFLSDALRAFPDAEIIGADYTLDTLRNLGARLPTIPLLRFDLTRCPLPDACCDAVVALNVLEHIERDDLAMRQISRILRPGGIVVLEVPAGPSLFDAYDEHLMHFRRYRMAGLIALAGKSGLEVIDHGHLGFLLYPPFWVTKKLARWREASSASQRETRVRRANQTTRMAGAMGRTLMAAEAAIRGVIHLPVGIRCLVTARRPVLSQTSAGREDVG